MIYTHVLGPINVRSRPDLPFLGNNSLIEEKDIHIHPNKYFVKSSNDMFQNASYAQSWQKVD